MYQKCMRVCLLLDFHSTVKTLPLMKRRHPRHLGFNPQEDKVRPISNRKIKSEMGRVSGVYFEGKKVWYELRTWLSIQWKTSSISFGNVPIIKNYCKLYILSRKVFFSRSQFSVRISIHYIRLNCRAASD